MLYESKSKMGYWLSALPRFIVKSTEMMQCARVCLTASLVHQAHLPSDHSNEQVMLLPVSQLLSLQSQVTQARFSYVLHA